jgi:hypothetical protein
MATTEIHRHEGGGSSAAPWIAFLVGVVLVGAIVAFFVLGGRGLEAPTKQVNVDINAPRLPEVNLPEAPRLPNG